MAEKAHLEKHQPGISPSGRKTRVLRGGRQLAAGQTKLPCPSGDPPPVSNLPTRGRPEIFAPSPSRGRRTAGGHRGLRVAYFQSPGQAGPPTRASCVAPPPFPHLLCCRPEALTSSRVRDGGESLQGWGSRSGDGGPGTRLPWWTRDREGGAGPSPPCQAALICLPPSGVVWEGGGLSVSGFGSAWTLGESRSPSLCCQGLSPCGWTAARATRRDGGPAACPQALTITSKAAPRTLHTHTVLHTHTYSQLCTLTLTHTHCSHHKSLRFSIYEDPFPKKVPVVGSERTLRAACSAHGRWAGGAAGCQGR